MDRTAQNRAATPRAHVALDPRERRIRLRLRDDFEHYTVKCLKIVAKDGALVPLRLNRAQRAMHAAIERQLAETGKVRALILKGRQQGASTYVEGKFTGGRPYRERADLRAAQLSRLTTASNSASACAGAASARPEAWIGEPMQLFLPITKVDAKQRLVYGTLAEEVPDKAGEIFDYASSKPNFERWSAEIARNSDGKSRGNLRAMHGHVAAGKLTDLAFDDRARRIEACAKVVDEAEWAKVLEGVYTGFSIGGKYSRRWKDEREPELTRYTAEPAEVSLVDNPCIPSATFAMIKEDGTCEVRKFRGTAKGDHAAGAGADSAPAMARVPRQVWTCGIAAHEHMAKAEALACIAHQEAELVAKGAQVEAAGDSDEGHPDTSAKREEGKDFPASDYAYVPDPERPSTWKLRLTSAPGGDPDPRIVGAAVAALGAGFRGNRVEIPEGDRARVVARVRAAWLRAHPGKAEADLPDPLKPESAKAAESQALRKGEGGPACSVETTTEPEPRVPLAETSDAEGGRGEPGSSAATGPLAKAGARHSKADLERVQLVHDTAVALGADCAGAAAEGGKAMGAELAKLHAALSRAGEERNALAKRLAELEPRLASLDARLERVEAQPLPPKGVLKAVDKKGDNVDDAAGAEAAPDPNDPLALVKQAQKHPKPLFAMIGRG